MKWGPVSSSGWNTLTAPQAKQKSEIFEGEELAITWGTGKSASHLRVTCEFTCGHLTVIGFPINRLGVMTEKRIKERKN